MCDDCDFHDETETDNDDLTLVLDLLGEKPVVQVRNLLAALEELDKAHMMAALALKGLDPDSPSAELLGHSLEYLDGVRAALSSRG